MIQSNVYKSKHTSFLAISQRRKEPQRVLSRLFAEGCKHLVEVRHLDFIQFVGDSITRASFVLNTMNGVPSPQSCVVLEPLILDRSGPRARVYLTVKESKAF